jgi:hypothetical protein
MATAYVIPALLLRLLPLLLTSEAVEVEVNADAGIVEEGANPNGFQAIFQNHAAGKADLFWDDGDDGIKVGELEAGGEAEVETFNNHVFYVRDSVNSSLLAAFRVQKDRKHYEWPVHNLTTRATVEPKRGRLMGEVRRFKNLLSETLDVYWCQSPTVCTEFQARLKPGGSFSTVAYTGHIFGWCTTAEQMEILKVVHVNFEEPESLNVFLPPDGTATQAKTEYERDLVDWEQYKLETGREWLTHWPKPPPLHFMWPAREVGEVHSVRSTIHHTLTILTMH